MTMSNVILLVFTVLLEAGGVVGFVKAGSKASLIASSIFALPLLLALMFASGGGMMLQMAASNTVLQTVVEASKRGRVMALFGMAYAGLAPPGTALRLGTLPRERFVPWPFVSWVVCPLTTSPGGGGGRAFPRCGGRCQE